MKQIVAKVWFVSCVAFGASLEVNGTDERIGELSGEGTVDFVGGRMELAGASTFAGTLLFVR